VGAASTALVWYTILYAVHPAVRGGRIVKRAEAKDAAATG